jgi:hypothetical protein
MLKVDLSCILKRFKIALIFSSALLLKAQSVDKNNDFNQELNHFAQQLGSLPSDPKKTELLSLNEFLTMVEEVASLTNAGFCITYLPNSRTFQFETIKEALIKFSGPKDSVFLSESIISIWRLIVHFYSQSINDRSLLENIYFCFGKNAFIKAFEHFSNESYMAWVERGGVDFIARQHQLEKLKTKKNDTGFFHSALSLISYFYQPVSETTANTSQTTVNTNQKSHTKKE